MSALRYGAPFPSKRIPTKPIALTPPSDEAMKATFDPDRALVEELAEKLRTEYYRKFLPWATMTVWGTLGEHRKEPWRLNARTAMEFLRDHR